MSAHMFVLVHSPLVGPSTWKLVAHELRARGLTAVVPSLQAEGSGEPYWRQHAEAVAAQIPDAGPMLVLVGHSGACPLLPAIGAAVTAPVAAYVFVDGDLPLVPVGGSRLDLLRAASPALADDLETLLDEGDHRPRPGIAPSVELATPAVLSSTDATRRAANRAASTCSGM